MIVHSDVCGETDVRADGPGWEPFWNLWANGEWEEWTLNELRKADLQDRWFIDVGAWIGPVSMWAHVFGAKVLAIEPDPIAFSALRANMRANNCWRVTTSCRAVATKTGVALLAANRGGELGNSSSRLSNKGIQVPCSTLPEALEQFKIPIGEIALVKIDIEGYERELMPVLQPWLDKHGIRALVSEHPNEPPSMARIIQ